MLLNNTPADPMVKDEPEDPLPLSVDSASLPPSTVALPSVSVLTVKNELDSTLLNLSETTISAQQSFPLGIKLEDGPELQPKLEPEPKSEPEPTPELEPGSRPKPRPRPRPEPGVNLPTPAEKAYEAVRLIDGTRYTIENALARGERMVDTIGLYFQEMDLGTSLRREVWLREAQSLKNRQVPTTMIAVCGATGAGKSSLLNAVLDDNIVPTSGVRACTAVVTEIRHHSAKTIIAKIEFLALSEWRLEIGALLHDLLGHDGKVRCVPDLRSDAGIAWYKIHAVYPLLSVDDLVKMTPDEIIATNPDTQRILGTIRTIESPNSEVFGLEIANYVGSKDHKRNKNADRGGSKPSDPALWPLIRLVRIRCDAEPLQFGAVLVDLPGVADANLARSSIAKDYMKKCDHIWIAAPITRATDEKAAKDLLGEAFKTQLMNGNYDDRNVTFVATKTDDLSCVEVVRNLGLEDDPEFVDIEEARIEARDAISEWTAVAERATLQLAETTDKIEIAQSSLREYEQQLTASRSENRQRQIAATHKNVEITRKRKRISGACTLKRQRSHGNQHIAADDREDELDVDDEVIVISSDSDDEDAMVTSDSDDGTSNDESALQADSSRLIQENLQRDIGGTQLELKALSEHHTMQLKIYQNATAKIAEHKKSQEKFRKEKNKFCSFKRSEHSRMVLKEDFRQGVKQLDEANEESINPDSCHDPSNTLRDYDKIDLPVFACSSRDYMRLKDQTKEADEPTCFANTEQTGIPSLQRWCRHLPASTREKFVSSLLSELSTFLRSVHTYLGDIEGVSASDCEKLTNMWASSMLLRDFGDDLGLTESTPAPFVSPPSSPGWTPDQSALDRSVSPELLDNRLDQIAWRIEEAEEHRRATLPLDQSKGVSFRLRKTLKHIVLKSSVQLKQEFRRRIERQCRVGAERAKKAAVGTSDALAASMHWVAYRATLRRNGEHKTDFNADLVAPMTREIASSWNQLFESDLFTPILSEANTAIVKLLKEIEGSVPAGLKDRCEAQIQVTLTEVEAIMSNIRQNVKTVMNDEQKNISRSLVPHIKTSLLGGYRLALEQTGKGSVSRQKAGQIPKRSTLLTICKQAFFRDYIENKRNTMFHQSIESLFDKLIQAADTVGKLLGCALGELAEKASKAVEVSMSVLWAAHKENKLHVQKRRELKKNVFNMLEQLELWIAAGKHTPSVGDMDVGTSDA